MLTITQINNQITNLRNQIQTRSAEDDTHTFVPYMLTYAEQRQTAINQAITGLNLPDIEITESRLELSEKLSQFTADITMGLNIGGGDNAPAWLSRGQYMKDADYYQQFFAGLATVSSEMIVYIDNHPQMTIKTAEGKAIYQKWLDLETLDVNHSALFQHQQELVDLRAALAGALRIYGLTERQVEEIMRIS